jgi:hypothetical protein
MICVDIEKIESISKKEIKTFWNGKLYLIELVTDSGNVIKYTHTKKEKRDSDFKTIKESFGANKNIVEII